MLLEALMSVTERLSSFFSCQLVLHIILQLLDSLKLQTLQLNRRHLIALKQYCHIVFPEQGNHLTFMPKPKIYRSYRTEYYYIIIVAHIDKGIMHNYGSVLSWYIVFSSKPTDLGHSVSWPKSTRLQWPHFIVLVCNNGCSSVYMHNILCMHTKQHNLFMYPKFYEICTTQRLWKLVYSE